MKKAIAVITTILIMIPALTFGSYAADDKKIVIDSVTANINITSPTNINSPARLPGKSSFKTMSLCIAVGYKINSDTNINQRFRIRVI